MERFALAALGAACCLATLPGRAGAGVARQTARAVSSRAGAPLLLRLAREAEFPFVRGEAVSALAELAGRPFEGFDPEADPEANRAALEAMEAWVASLAPE